MKEHRKKYGGNKAETKTETEKRISKMTIKKAYGNREENEKKKCPSL